MAQLSSILKQATGVVAARGEGVHLFDEDDRDREPGWSCKGTPSRDPSDERHLVPAKERFDARHRAHEVGAVGTVNPGRAQDEVSGVGGAVSLTLVDSCTEPKSVVVSAASAWSCARCPVKSRATLTYPVTSPSGVRIGDSTPLAKNREPSLRRNSFS